MPHTNTGVGGGGGEGQECGWKEGGLGATNGRNKKTAAGEKKKEKENLNEWEYIPWYVWMLILKKKKKRKKKGWRKETKTLSSWPHPWFAHKLNTFHAVPFSCMKPGAGKCPRGKQQMKMKGHCQWQGPQAKGLSALLGGSGTSLNIHSTCTNLFVWNLLQDI